MKGKVNKRVDKCVHILMKIARDKAYKRLVKLQKAKLTLRQVKITRRHKKSLAMTITMVIRVDENNWKIVENNWKIVGYG